MSQRGSIPKLYAVEDAAKRLGRSHWALRRAIKAGRIPGVRLGNRLFVEESVLVKMVEDGRRIAAEQVVRR